MLHEHKYLGMVSETYTKGDAHIYWRPDQSGQEMTVFGRDKGIGQPFVFPVARFLLEDGGITWVRDTWIGHPILFEKCAEIMADCHAYFKKQARSRNKEAAE